MKGLISENINTLMPGAIAFCHDGMINRYIERGSRVLIRTGSLYFPMLTKKGYIIKANVQFTLNTNVFEDFLVDARVKNNPSNCGLILVDLKGLIINMSEQIY
jgi:hypothetical protein